MKKIFAIALYIITIALIVINIICYGYINGVTCLAIASFGVASWLTYSHVNHLDRES